MPPRKFLLLSAVAAAIVALLAATEARATDQTLPSPGITTPNRLCQLSNVPVLLSTQKVDIKIVAGPEGLSGYGLAEEFPVTEACPDGFGPGICKKWNYRWIVTSAAGASTPTLSTALVSVDTDVTVHSSTPAATVVKSVPSFISLDTEGERFLKFNPSNAAEFNASFWTPSSVSPGTITAAAIGKKGGSLNFFSTRCALAGADNVIVEQNQAVTNVVRSQAGPCTVDRTLDAKGRTVSMVLVPPSPAEQCPIALVDIVVNGTTVIDSFISPEAQLTFGTNTRYCFASARGGMTCVGTP